MRSDEEKLEVMYRVRPEYLLPFQRDLAVVQDACRRVNGATQSCERVRYGVSNVCDGCLLATGRRREDLHTGAENFPT